MLVMRLVPGGPALSRGSSLGHLFEYRAGERYAQSRMKVNDFRLSEISYPIPPFRSRFCPLSFPVVPDSFCKEREGNILSAPTRASHFFHHAHGAIGISGVNEYGRGAL